MRVSLLLEEGLALCKEIGSQVGSALWSYLAGQVALHQENTTQARSFLEESVAIFKEMGDRRHTAQSISSLAGVEAVRSNYAAARALYEESVALCREVRYILGIASALEGLAGVVGAQGELPWAARLWGTAEALREAMRTPLPPVYRADYEHAVAAARAQLGEQAFAAAWAEGSTMTPEQALAARGPLTMPTPAPAGPSSVPPPPEAPAYTAGLTTREMEVLRLLALGLTSAQIAQRLVIGLVTVNSHVRSIYSKLGVTSRAAATRYALEHRLL